MSADDVGVIRKLVDESSQKAWSTSRPALGSLFSTLALVLRPDSPAGDIELDLADLDGDEVEAVIEGLIARHAREEVDGNTARAAFYADLRVGLEAERERRRSVLDAIDRAISWYDARAIG